MFQSNLRIKSAVLIFSFLLSLFVYWQNPQATKLVQIYGLVSVAYILLVMFPGPLYRLYPNFPVKNFYRQTLGGLGISAFYFAFLHSYIAFFKTLEGFKGLFFLGNFYLLSTIFGFVGLLILAALAGTSFTWAMKALGRKWKTLHRFIYLAGILIVLHTIMVGSHFRDFTRSTASIFVIAFTALMLLQTMSTYQYLLFKFPAVPSRYFRTALSFVFIASFYLLFILHQYIIGGHHLH